METFESEMESSWDEMLASMEQTFGESFSVDVLVKDDLVSGYRFETTMPIESDEYETEYTQEIVDTLDAAESSEDAAETEEESAEITEELEEANVAFDFTFTDPSDIGKGYTCKCTVTTDEDKVDMLFDLASDTDGIYRKVYRNV